MLGTFSLHLQQAETVIADDFNRFQNDDPDRIERARRMSDEEKFLAGFKLYQEERERVKHSMRNLFPALSDAELNQKVKEALRPIDDYPPGYRP